MPSCLSLFVALSLIVPCGNLGGLTNLDAPEPDDPLPAHALARFGSLRFNHGDLIREMALSPDGKYLATADQNGGIRLWNTANGKQIRELPKQGSSNSALAFSPDSATLATGKEGGTVYLWDAATGKEKGTLRNLGYIYSMAFSPDGQTLAFTNHTIHILDLTTSKIVRSFKGSSAQHIVYSPDGKLLASWSQNRLDRGENNEILRIWDVAKGEELYQLKGHQGWVGQAVFSPDSKLVASAGQFDGTVRLWRLPPGGREPRVLNNLGAEHAIAFTPDGKKLATHSYPGNILLWELGEKPVSSQIASKASATHLLFTPDGKTLYTCGRDTFVHVWNVETGKERYPHAGYGAIGKGSFAPDGSTITTYGVWDRTLHTLRLSSGEELSSSSPPWIAGPETLDASFTFSTDGKTAAVADHKGVIRLWTGGTSRELATLAGARSNLFGLCFSPDGKRLAVSGAEDMTITLLDVASGKKIFAKPHQRANPVFGMAFSPDGQTLAGGSQDKVIGLWDAATGIEIGQCLGHEGVIFSLVFSADGRTLASSSNDHTARIWEVATRRQRGIFLGHTRAELTRALLAPDGRTLITCGYDSTIRLWDMATGKERERLTGHLGPIFWMGIAPGGSRLVSGGADGTLMVWDLASLRATKPASPPPLSSKAKDGLWAQLAEADAAKAYRAVCELVDAQEQGVTLLRERLQPAAAVDPKIGSQIDKAIADLDHDEFRRRETASEQLASLGASAAPPLRNALAGKLSVESRRRIEQLVEKLGGPLPPDELRSIRAVESLEMIGSPQAKQVLEKLAGGAAGARVTREAQASVARLGVRDKTVQ